MNTTLEEDLQFAKDYRAIYESSPDMFCSVYAKDGTLRDVNPTFLNRMGYEKNEILGSPIFSIIHPDSIERVKELFVQFQKTGFIRNERVDFKRKDGSKVTTLLNTAPVLDKNGDIFCSNSILRDISEVAYLEEVIKERTKEIEVKNKELQYINYLVSNDLHVSAKKLVEDIRELQKSRAEDFEDNQLASVMESVDRIDYLISEIKKYGIKD